MSPTWVVLLVYLGAFFPAHIWLLVKNHRTYRALLDCDKDLIELMADPLPRPDEGWERTRLFDLILFAWDAPKEMAEATTTDELYDIVRARRNAQIAIQEYQDSDNWWAAGTVLHADVLVLSRAGQFSKRVADRLAAAVRYARSAKADILEESRPDMLEALGDHII